jgi:2-polyprenyl-3-methyl-5-hydroxy-6-metoxy-1,4-benzoquinol methylase
MLVLTYETLERIFVDKPVDRVGYIANLCQDKVVLDLGCYDETAVNKLGTEHWLHGRISNVARIVMGVDAADAIPENGLRIKNSSMIFKGNVLRLPESIVEKYDYDVIVAGELIEHLENPLGFLLMIKAKFPGKKFLLSTPNAISLSNALMGVIGREAQHKDHLAIFSYKILNTLCERAGYKAWVIRPYRFYATEMILECKGIKKLFVLVVEKCVRFLEWWFPLLSFGYIVVVEV